MEMERELLVAQGSLLRVEFVSETRRSAALDQGITGEQRPCRHCHLHKSEGEGRSITNKNLLRSARGQLDTTYGTNGSTLL